MTEAAKTFGLLMLLAILITAWFMLPDYFRLF
jgi:hypothetical protein